MDNNKAKRKAERKVKRAVEVMRKDFSDICHSKEYPTETIFVCNLGLMTGCSYESLAERFLAFGNLSEVIMLPGKSYSFLRFSEVSEASAAYKALHMSEFDSVVIMYLAFVDSLPKINPSWDRDLPPGLRIIKDFVTPEREEEILSSLKWSTEAAELKHRQVQHFGYEFKYGSNSIDYENPVRPIPESWTEPLPLTGFDQCTVNRYEPGQGIPPHVDTHSCCTDTIFSLSLGSDTVMNFSKGNDDDNKNIPVILPRRSLLIMSGESRYAYKHGITPRTFDIIPKDGKGLTLSKRGLRVSLTFRKVLKEPCKCAFPTYCDSQKDLKVQLDDKMAWKLESLHVHSVYEEIAGHFSETRHSPWPKVMSFLDEIPPGGILLDIGCGNGKYLGHHPLQIQVGCDYSLGLLAIVNERKLNGVRSDCLNLPFKSNLADAFICIAVIHHLSTPERRKAAVIEMNRVLKIGGKGLIYAWAKDQAKDSVASSYLKQKSVKSVVGNKLEKCQTDFPLVLPVHNNRTNFQHSDLLVPWKKNANKSKEEKEEEEVFHRFYHVFEEGELEDLINSVSGVEIVKSYYDQGNWCVILEKTKSS